MVTEKMVFENRRILCSKGIKKFYFDKKTQNPEKGPESLSEFVKFFIKPLYLEY